MRAMSKTMWVTLNVGAAGAVVGISLMLAGDWLGRRDEATLKAAVTSSSLPQTPQRAMARPSPASTLPLPVEARPSRKADAMLTDAKAPGGPQLISKALTALQGGARSQPTKEVVAQAAQAVTVVSDQERLVDRQQILKVTKGNPFQLLTQTPLAPHLEGSKSGLRISSVVDSPWAAQVGVKTGDILTAVNGKPILDPRQMAAVARDLFSAPEVNITIQRAGQEMTLRFHMRPSAQTP